MAKMKVCWGLATAVLALPAPALAEVKLEGYFIARTKCPAFQSVRKQSNLGDVYTQAGRVYELRGKNKEPGSHYKIRIDGQPPDRWVAMNCGEHVVPMGADGQRGSASRSDATSNCGGSGRACFQEMSVVLAVSWQPAFCERHPLKPECKTQAPDRFDANHFALHGLWPDGVYCGVSDEIMGKDKTNKWDQLPPLALSQTLRRELLKKMPGMLSALHRHEWIKHGTCYGDATPQKYFEDSASVFGRAQPFICPDHVRGTNRTASTGFGRTGCVRPSFRTRRGQQRDRQMWAGRVTNVDRRTSAQSAGQPCNGPTRERPVRCGLQARWMRWWGCRCSGPAMTWTRSSCVRFVANALPATLPVRLSQLLQAMDLGYACPILLANSDT